MNRFATFLGAALIGTCANAAPFDLAPTADGTVITFGGTVVDTTSATMAFSQSGGNITNLILEFDLTSIPDTDTITSIDLTLTLTRFVSNVGGAAAVDIFAFAGDGTVTAGDFGAAADQVNDAAETTATGGVAGDTRTFSFTSLSEVQDLLVGNLLTLRLETDSFASIQVASINNSVYDGALLSIETDGDGSSSVVPLPAPAALLLGGLGAFGLLRRRR